MPAHSPRHSVAPRHFMWPRKIKLLQRKTGVFWNPKIPYFRHKEWRGANNSPGISYLGLFFGFSR